MNYSRIYSELIENAQSRNNMVGYVEKHHIIPKCFGGDDDDTNLVRLYPREHFVAHLLLYKMQTQKRKQHQMLLAIVMMGGKGMYNSRVYSNLKERFSKEQSERMTGVGHPLFGKVHPSKGKSNLFKLSDSARIKISKQKSGMVSALDTRTNEKLWASKEDFDKFDYYVGQTSGQPSKLKNKMAITDGIKTKFIEPNDLEKYIMEGWRKGMKPRQKSSCAVCGKMFDPGNLVRHLKICKKQTEDKC